MYLPYLRNRTNEVFAVLESAPVISAQRLVLPLFNLVDEGPHFPARLHKIAAAKQPVALIVNTASRLKWVEVANLAAAVQAVYPGMVFPAFEISEATTQADLAWFAAQFSRVPTLFVHRVPAAFSGLDAALINFASPPIHVASLAAVASVRQLRAPRRGDVVMVDAFSRQIVNGAYPARSPFSNHAYSYSSYGFNGFSDFATIGDHFKKGGGQASHVALHLTEPSGANLVCNHFVSHSTPKSAGIRFKYVDALSQLRAHVASNPAPFATTGAQEYVAAHAYRGLGIAKRWSIRHHLELMHHILSSAGASSLI